jgi:hypothetical protein
MFVVQVRGADGEDRSLGRGLVAEPLQVGLAARAFPREPGGDERKPYQPGKPESATSP